MFISFESKLVPTANVQVPLVQIYFTEVPDSCQLISVCTRSCSLRQITDVGPTFLYLKRESTNAVV